MILNEFAPKESGTLFVWGRGENGRLGTGGIKDGLEYGFGLIYQKFSSEFVPIRIQIPTRQLINSIVFVFFFIHF
jgi:hypothetical protein